MNYRPKGSHLISSQPTQRHTLTQITPRKTNDSPNLIMSSQKQKNVRQQKSNSQKLRHLPAATMNQLNLPSQKFLKMKQSQKELMKSYLLCSHQKILTTKKILLQNILYVYIIQEKLKKAQLKNFLYIFCFFTNESKYFLKIKELYLMI